MAGGGGGGGDLIFPRQHADRVECTQYTVAGRQRYKQEATAGDSSEESIWLLGCDAS